MKCLDSEAAHNEDEKGPFFSPRVRKCVVYFHLRETCTSLSHQCASKIELQVDLLYMHDVQELGCGLTTIRPEKDDRDQMSRSEVPKTWPSTHRRKRKHLNRGCFKFPIRQCLKGPRTKPLMSSSWTCGQRRGGHKCLEGKSLCEAIRYCVPFGNADDNNVRCRRI